MVASLKKTPKALPRALWQGLPPTMRMLHITNRQRTGGWLAEAFAADSASQVALEEAVGSASGLARLRDEIYDAVLVAHEPGELDALDLVEGYRAGGADEPIVVLGIQSEQEMAALCFEVGADGYLCVNTATTRTLLWIVARAMHRHRLASENRRLNQAEQQRLRRERDEAQRLLLEQRSLISPQPDAENLGGWPDELIRHYRELLRAYVIMGSGNLSGELARLADLLATAGLSPYQAMALHLHVLEELIHGLGARSTRHVMTRADLLVLEIMIHLGESYRQRYQERVAPPVQQLLPGFEPALGAIACLTPTPR